MIIELLSLKKQEVVDKYYKNESEDFKKGFLKAYEVLSEVIGNDLDFKNFKKLSKLRSKHNALQYDFATYEAKMELEITNIKAINYKLIEAFKIMYYLRNSNMPSKNEKFKKLLEDLNEFINLDE